MNKLKSFRKKIGKAVNRLRGVHFGAISMAEIATHVGKPDPTILEIGANDGVDSQRLLDAFPAARLFAFEPDPRAAQRWRERVLDHNAVLSEIAISEKDGETQFHQSGGKPGENYGREWDYSGSIRAPKAHLEEWPWVRFDTTITVRTRALDSWTAEQGLETIDFIWADVQGAESDLVAGGKETLARTHFFYTEYNNQEMYEGQASLQELKTMLGSDFEIVKRWTNDVLFRNKGFLK